MDHLYIHNLSPFAVHFGNAFGIRWYGLAYLAGFYLGYLIIRHLSQRKLTQIAPETAGDLVFALALGAVIGGRLGYCLLYSPELFFRISSDIPFWGVLAINEGGMASHGGIAGVMISAYLFARKRGISALHLIDLATLGGSIGIFFGRIANFVNGELIGRPIESMVPWAVKFPQDILAWPSQSPDKLALLEPLVSQVGVNASLWKQWTLNLPLYYGKIQATLYSLIDAIQSGNQGLRQSLGQYLVARHPSQIYEALLEGALVFLVLVFFWRHPKKPGVIAAIFGITYAVVRIIGEAFRMPDAHIGYEIFGLTRGQLLSLVMLVVMVILLVAARRRNAETLGGWLHGKGN